ncbi:MAG: ArnT family glycosyltransferase [Bacteroidia bacterium]
MKQVSVLPFRLFCLAFILALLLPELMKDGMFADGVLYASVAHNEAKGFGSFWFPQFSQTVFLPFFHQQPPLTFGILSLFYRVFGDSIYVERGYSLLCALVSALLLSGCWRLTYRGHPAGKSLSWLPVLFWIITPVCFYSYRNNLEENSLGVFTLLSLYFLLKGQENSNVMYDLFAALSILLAMLCKGFPGLFPLAFPFLHWIIFRTSSLTKMLLHSARLCFLLILSVALLLLIPEARISLGAYVHDRVLNSIMNVDTGLGRFHLVVQLAADLGVPAGILALFLIILRSSGFRAPLFEKTSARIGVLFILLGLCASLPLMITREQRWFYPLASLPAFAIGIASFGVQPMQLIMERIRIRPKLVRILNYCAAGLLALTLGYTITLYGKIRSEEEPDVSDSYIIGKALPPGTILNTFPETYNNWSMQQYLSRYFSLSLTGEYPKMKYFLTDRSMNKRPGPEYQKMDLPTSKYDLYKSIKTGNP